MMAIRELKVCLLGDTGVGKSSIVCRFVQDHFDHNISPTIGASFMTKTVPCGNELHKFLIWDTAGQERPREGETPLQAPPANSTCSESAPDPLLEGNASPCSAFP
uniref:RAB31, member RAS onco family n=1 Tax=Equus caballus TaxID=9796 RepID=A0A3Q2HY15_HORSE